MDYLKIAENLRAKAASTTSVAEAQACLKKAKELEDKYGQRKVRFEFHYEDFNGYPEAQRRYNEAESATVPRGWIRDFDGIIAEEYQTDEWADQEGW